MKNCLLCLIGLFFSLFLSAQNGAYKWSGTAGTSGFEMNQSICTDNRGNLYATGVFSGSCDLDPGSGSTVLTCVGGNDVFVRKMTADGQFVWAKSFVGTSGYDRGYAIRSDGDKGLLVAGNFDSTVDFDPGPGQASYTAQGVEDLFLVKLDTNGNFLWAKTLHSFARIVPGDLQVDGSGNIFITGQFNGTVDFDPGNGTYNLTSGSVADIFICKLDAAGNFLWARNLEADAANNSGGGLAVDGQGNAVVVGYFYGNIDLDPGANAAMHSSQGNTDICVVKLDANGNFLWGHTYGNSSVDLASAVAVDDQANTYITGQFSGIVDFEPGTGVTSCGTGGCRDVFILKLDATGALDWVRSLDGFGTLDSGNGVCVDAHGDVVVAGSFSADLDLDPGTGTQIAVHQDGRDVFVVKLNAAGNYVWGNAVGGTQNDIVLEVISGKRGEIFACGYFQGNIDLNPGSNQANYSSAGSLDMFTLALENITLVQREVPESAGVLVYPNPNQGRFRVMWETASRIQFRLFSPQGRLVRSGSAWSGAALEIGTSLPAGAYLLELTAGEQRSLHKLMLE